MENVLARDLLLRLPSNEECCESRFPNVVKCLILVKIIGQYSQMIIVQDYQQCQFNDRELNNKDCPEPNCRSGLRRVINVVSPYSI